MIRKLAELGYHRSAKKCKEKFENVYKYHKRTKEGRSGKSEGKSYKFFDQLQALENQHSSSIAAAQPPPTPTPSPQPKPLTVTITTPMQPPPQWTSSSATSPNPINVLPPQVPNPMVSTVMVNSSYPSGAGVNIFPSSNFQNVSSKLFSSSTSSSTASEEESDDEEYGNNENTNGSNKRKRKWNEFFKRLTKEVMKKQEDLQEKFLETIERRENERMAREEAWRIQEVARINREHEILIQERTTAAAKDAAVISFLQKFSGQQQQQHQPQQQNPPQTAITIVSRDQNPQQPPPPVPVPAPAPPQPSQQQPTPQVKPANNAEIGNNANNIYNNNAAVSSSPISSRWPKAEVEALIRFRTQLSHKYHENGPKGPLWEEISAAMRSVGYNRSAKRCKEKWENINKYFKKVKDSNKKRSGDSKTCPYFSQLDALYREKSSNTNQYGGRTVNISNSTPMIMEPPLMVEPERQWRPGQRDQNQQQPKAAGESTGEDDGDEEDEEGESTEEEDLEGGAGGYEMVADKTTVAAAGGSVGSGGER